MARNTAIPTTMRMQSSSRPIALPRLKGRHTTYRQVAGTKKPSGITWNKCGGVVASDPGPVLTGSPDELEPVGRATASIAVARCIGSNGSLACAQYGIFQGFRRGE